MRVLSRERGTMRPGAHRFQRVLAALGLREFAPQEVILVTGTNGKGSVCALLESAFRTAGFRTGLYTSPHLVNVTERVRIEGRPVSESYFACCADRAQKICGSVLPDITEFEVITAAACMAFCEHKVQIAIVEIGLGGLFDSTNAAAPVVSVLTTVGLDHQEYLGNSLLKIAADKAHISRRNVPFVVGDLCSESLCGVTSTSSKIGSILIRSSNLERESTDLVERILESGSSWHRLNASNLRVAVATLSAYERFSGTSFSFNWENVESGLRRAFWPGRFDVRSINNRPVIFDGAHNAPGIEYFFAQYDKSEFSGIMPQVVYASLSDKDWHFILPQLLKRASSMIVTAVASPRAVSPNVLLQIASGDNVVRQDSVKSALEYAFKTASNAPLLIIGSLSLVGEAMECLGVEPLSHDINRGECR